MLMDLTFLILSTCLHLNDTNFYISQQCQRQLTACYYKKQKEHPESSVDSVITYCILSKEVNFKTLERKSQK